MPPIEHQALATQSIKRPPGKNEAYIWGGVPHPKRHLLAPHFLLMGIPKSGKTWTIRMLMHSAIGGGPFPRHRCLVFDPKRDMFPIMTGMGIAPENIIVMNPFDARCSAWDIASDLTDRSSVREFATLLCPQDPQAKDPYWSRAVIDLVIGVIYGLIAKKGKEWGLADILNAARSPESLGATLETTDFGKQKAAFHLDQAESTARSVLSSLSSKLGLFEEVADLWSTASTKVSLKAWTESQGVLLLGMDPIRAATLGPINRAMFQRAAELVSSRVEEDPLDETWFVLDEVREIGRLDGLRTLMNLSRSKGARVVLGAQDKSGIEAEYGKETALEILSAASNVGILTLGCPDTANWASQYFGSYRAVVTNQTVQYSNSDDHYTWTGLAPSGVTFSKSRVEETAVLPQELMDLPLASPETGISGVFRSDLIGAWFAPIAAEEVRKMAPEKGAHPGLIVREAPALETLVKRKSVELESIVKPEGVPNGRRTFRLRLPERESE